LIKLKNQFTFDENVNASFIADENFPDITVDDKCTIAGWGKDRGIEYPLSHTRKFHTCIFGKFKNMPIGPKSDKMRNHFENQFLFRKIEIKQSFLTALNTGVSG